MDGLFTQEHQKRYLAMLETEQRRLARRVEMLLSANVAPDDPLRLALLDDLQCHIDRLDTELAMVGGTLTRQRGRQKAVGRYLQANSYGNQRSFKG